MGKCIYRGEKARFLLKFPKEGRWSEAAGRRQKWNRETTGLPQ